MRSNFKWVVSLLRLAAVIAIMMVVGGRAVTRAAAVEGGDEWCGWGNPPDWLATTHGADQDEAYAVCEELALSDGVCDGQGTGAEIAGNVLR